MTATPQDPAGVPVATFLTNAYAVFVGANVVVGCLVAIEACSHDPSIALVLIPLLWALLGQVLTPVVLGHVLTRGPPVVSHDVLPRDLVGREVLLVPCLLLAGGFLARRSVVGRWLSYVCVAALTLGVGIDLLGWIRQGL